MFLSQFVYFASSYSYYEMLFLKRNDNRKKTYKKIENKIRIYTGYTYIIYDLRDGGKKINTAVLEWNILRIYSVYSVLYLNIILFILISRIHKKICR